MNKINIKDKLDCFSDYLSPKIVGDVNDSYIKLAKFYGDFVWHSHENEDEMFFVMCGTLKIKFREKDVQVHEGEFIVIPKGIEHMPVAEEEVSVMLIEAKTTLNTGNTFNEKTVQNLERI